MSRKFNLGCLTVLVVLWYVFLSVILHAQGKLPFPCVSHDAADTLSSESFSVVYRPDLRIPISADWVLFKSDMGDTKREPSWRFAEDVRVPKPRARHDDYTHSGYDRGHMVPAADRSRSISTMKSTFVMTNVTPQVATLNRGPWKKLEESCRAYARNGHPLSIHVDAVFWLADTQYIGRDSVAVPHGFVKTVRNYPDDSIIYARYFQNY